MGGGSAPPSQTHSDGASDAIAGVLGLVNLILRVVGRGACQPFFAWSAFPFLAFHWFAFVFEGLSSHFLVGGPLKMVGRGTAQPSNQKVFQRPLKTCLKDCQRPVRGL